MSAAHEGARIAGNKKPPAGLLRAVTKAHIIPADTPFKTMAGATPGLTPAQQDCGYNGATSPAAPP